MSSDNFLSNRNRFSSDLGIPKLYEFIDQFSLYAGVHTLGSKLWTYELLKDTVGVPGDIYEFGSWKGANLMFLAKVNSLLEPSSPKNIFGFDNFSGLPEATKEDGDYAMHQQGNYHGNEAILRQAIELFELQSKVHLIVGDALETIPRYAQKNPAALCSFAYLDFDLYEPTRLALSFLDDCIASGGVIVFDEACTAQWPGETLAMKQYLANSQHQFDMLSNSISRQPTVALKRVA